MNAHHLLLAAIVALGFALRVWGIGFGLPDVPARPDESALAGVAMEFLQGRFWPLFFDYPRLMPYLLAVAYAVYGAIAVTAGWFDTFAQFLRTWTQYWPPLFLLGRWISAVLGVLTLIVIHRLATRTSGRQAGLIAALFLGVAFLHVRDSHYATTDVPMTFLCWVALAALVRAAEAHDTRALLAGTCTAALALSTKYSAVPAALSVAAVLLVWRAKGWIDTRGLVTNILKHAALGTAVFLVLNPYVVFDFERFRQGMALLSQSYSIGMKTQHHLGSGWVYHLVVTLRYGVGWPMLAAAAAGGIVILRRRPAEAAVLSAFVLPYYALAGESRLLFVRYAVPLVPFVSYAAAVAVDALVTRLGRACPKMLVLAGAAALISVISVPTLASSVDFDRLLSRRDTRGVAAEWARAHIPRGATIAQSGSEYGRVGFGFDAPYRNWEYWEAWGTYVDLHRRRASPRAGLPQYIVVHESPLPYSYVAPRMQQDIKAGYELVRVIRGLPASERRNVYDYQDAFFMPYAGFYGVSRPGPTIYIWKRRADVR